LLFIAALWFTIVYASIETLLLMFVNKHGLLLLIAAHYWLCTIVTND